MSYCVNCGVKLDPSLKYCPLCNTPVINPHDLSKMQPVSPFPKEKGQVEVVRRKDLAILLSVSLTAAGLCSLLLNLLVFRQHLWSLYVIGACVLIWVMSIPAVIYTKLPIYLSLLFDGLAVMLYQFLIGFNTRITAGSSDCPCRSPRSARWPRSSLLSVCAKFLLPF